MTTRAFVEQSDSLDAILVRLPLLCPNYFSLCLYRRPSNLGYSLVSGSEQPTHSRALRQPIGDDQMNAFQAKT